MNAPLASDEKQLLRCVHASLGYGRKIVLEEIHLTLSRGDFLGLVGPNGAGKSTLLRGLLGILKPRAGSITARRGLRFGYMPQRFRIDPVFPLRVREIVNGGRLPHTGLFGRPGRDDRRRVDAALDRLGIRPLEHSFFRDLSGGQQQRALLARAIAVEPDVLVLDEPTNGMDLPSEAAIVDLVHEMRRSEGVAVLFVTHDLNLVASRATRLALISKGRVAEGSRDEMLRPERLQSIYGVPVRVISADGEWFVRTASRDLGAGGGP